MAEARFSEVSLEVSFGQGSKTSVSFQVVSFMVFIETRPTTARGLFTKVLLQHHPQKWLWSSLPKLTWESNRRNCTVPCKTCPNHFVTFFTDVCYGRNDCLQKTEAPGMNPATGWKSNENGLIIPFPKSMLTYQVWVIKCLRIKMPIRNISGKGEWNSIRRQRLGWMSSKWKKCFLSDWNIIECFTSQQE